MGGEKCLEINTIFISYVVNDIYFTNCNFTQSKLYSVDFLGVGSINRIKFTQCSIANGNITNSTALRVAGTGIGANIPEAIDFIGCDFYNSFGSAITTNGLIFNGIRSFILNNCRISGFNVGVDITPYNSNNLTSFNIESCIIGPNENLPGNVIGLRVNAGSFTYKESSLISNNLSGNTTNNFVLNGNFNNNLFNVINNFGMTLQPVASTPNLLLTTANTAVRAGNAIPIITNTVRPGTQIQFYIHVTNAAIASINTISLRYGTNNTNADAVIHTFTLGIGSAIAGGALIMVNAIFLSSTKIISSINVMNNGTTGFTNNSQVSVLTAPATIATNTNNFLGVYISPSAANSVTIRSSTINVLSQ